MAIAQTYLDIDDEDELRELPRVLANTRGSIVLRKRGRDVAVVTPLNSPVLPDAPDGRKRAAREASLASFDSWSGLIDNNVAEQRDRDLDDSAASTSPARQHAVIRPIDNPEELAALLSVAGSWADVDTDALIEDLYRQRTLNTRPPVDL